MQLADFKYIIYNKQKYVFFILKQHFQKGTVFMALIMVLFPKNKTKKSWNRRPDPA